MNTFCEIKSVISASNLSHAPASCSSPDRLRDRARRECPGSAWVRQNPAVIPPYTSRLIMKPYWSKGARDARGTRRHHGRSAAGNRRAGRRGTGRQCRSATNRGVPKYPPEIQTINPKPFTLNPDLNTLNPEPRTPNLKP